jgi:hypothetical protein
MSTASLETEIKDEHYDLVSVLYHTLKQGAKCQQFKSNASEVGDSELEDLFTEICEESRDRATQIKALLADRIMETADDEEVSLSSEERDISSESPTSPH